jgi:tRNA threonylcarbamoyladenosine biosynthesis protein TsaB
VACKSRTFFFINLRMSPVVLGLDTSGPWCSAALLQAGALYVRRAEVGNAHSAHLLGMIRAVLDDAGLALGDCDVLAFGAGPGSFTGLRVACAVAQGLAFGSDLSVAAIGTLDAIAHSVLAAEPWSPALASSLLIAQDARMGEVYWSLFDVHGDALRSVSGPRLCAPERLGDAIALLGRSLPVVLGGGNAWAVHGARMEGLATRVVARPAADAADVAALGLRAWHEDTLVAADQASPIYVRDDVALTIRERTERKNAIGTISA